MGHRSGHLRLLEHPRVRGARPPAGPAHGGVGRHPRGRRFRGRAPAARRGVQRLVGALRVPLGRPTSSSTPCRRPRTPWSGWASNCLATCGLRCRSRSAGRATKPSCTSRWGIEDCLLALKDAGVRLGIICDVGFTPSNVLREHLIRRGLLPLFDHWSFSDEVGAYKPAPAIFNHALEGLGGPEPERVAHVGDLRRTDVAGALGMGMTAVALHGASSTTTRWISPEAHHVISAHADLPGVLGCRADTSGRDRRRSGDLPLFRRALPTELPGPCCRPPRQLVLLYLLGGRS